MPASIANVSQFIHSAAFMMTVQFAFSAVRPAIDGGSMDAIISGAAFSLRSEAIFFSI